MINDKATEDVLPGAFGSLRHQFTQVFAQRLIRGASLFPRRGARRHDHRLFLEEVVIVVWNTKQL